MLKYIRALFLILIFSPLPLQAYYWSPHIGVDWKYWGAKPKNNQAEYFKETWPDISNALSFYVGSRVNGFFGFDLGYEQSTTKEERHIFDGTQTFLTSNLVPMDDASHTEVRLKAWYAHFNFYWEMARNLELIGMVGLSTQKPDTHIFYTTAAGAATEISQSTKSKAAARLGIGMQYNPWWFLGLKAMVMFDQMSRLNYEGQNINQNFFSIKPYKNATSFHLGFVFSYSPPRR